MSPTVFVNNARISQASPSNLELPQPNPQVRAFHKSLPEYKPTPLISLPLIAQELGIHSLLLKDESSRLGLPAFKMLGASWATFKVLSQKLGLESENASLDAKCVSAGEVSLESLAAGVQAEGIVLYAATDGNHGRAVARMAKYLGIRAMIYVPLMLDLEARSKVESEGATVVVVDGDYDHTVLATKAAAENHMDGKGVLISDTALSINDQVPKWIVEGYQTLFDELEEEIVGVSRDSEIDFRVTHVLTPVGVGSLAQAVVTHFARSEDKGKGAMIVTVEPKSAACLKSSLEEGEMVTVDATYTICTGMCCGTLSAIGWPVLKEGVDIAVTVEDGEVHDAVLELEKYGVLAGPCGAATLAGLRHLVTFEEFQFGPGAIVVILCTEGKRGYDLRY